MTIRQLYDQLMREMADNSTGANTLYVYADHKLYPLEKVVFEYSSAMLVAGREEE